MNYKIILDQNIEEKQQPENKQNNPVENIQQKNEITEIVQILNNDSLEIDDTNMTSLDTKTNLNPKLIRNIAAFDTLTSMGVYSTKSLMLTRQLKRLLVSLNAMGRNNIVDIVNGRQEHIENSAVGGSKIKNLFGLRK